MPGRRPQPRLTRLFVVLAGATGLAGLLAMHGLAPAHDVTALRGLHGHAASEMSAHLEPTLAGGAAQGVPGNGITVGTLSQASVSVSDMLSIFAGRDVVRGAAHAGAGLMNGVMSHGATGACLAILSAGLLVAMMRRRSECWPVSDTLSRTVAARAGHAVRAHLRCRVPSHLELCVWRT